MTSPRCSRLRRDFSFNPENIFALGDGAIRVNPAEDCPAAANLSVVNYHKSSKRWDPIVIVDHQRTARLNREPADFVALELLAFLLRRFERGRIHYLIDRNDFTFHILGGEAQIVKM